MLVITDVNARELILDRLRERATEKGMADVARETGIPRSHLYTLLSGDGNPTLDSLLKLGKALGLSFEMKQIPPSDEKIADHDKG